MPMNYEWIKELEQHQANRRFSEAWARYVQASHDQFVHAYMRAIARKLFQFKSIR
jgi:predicted trehalose synthase